MTQEYESDPTRRGYVPGSTGPNIEMSTAVTTPVDRLRWAAVLGGLFMALATLVVLLLLGSAIGLSAYDPGDRARTYGVGAAIWSALSVLIAFFVGGWFAARAAAVRGSNNGIMNGAMVWAVAIPLMFLAFTGPIGYFFSRTADTDRVIRATVRTDDTGQPTANVDRDAVRTGRRAAWGSLISVLLGLGAASYGGYTGARGYYGRPRTPGGVRDDFGTAGPTGTTGPTTNP